MSSVFAQVVNRNESMVSGSAGNTTINFNAKQESSGIEGTGINYWEPGWAGKKVNEIRALRTERIATGLAASPGYQKKANARLAPR